MVDDINNRAHAAEPESNGELERLREELKAKSEALRTAQSALTRVEGDLKNLLNEGELAVLMVDGGLSIRRSSPAAQRILGLPADSALPLSEIAASRGFHDLSERVEQVLESLTSQVYETTDARGRWYRVSIRPYKFTQNTVDGAVVYLLDIDALKRLVDDAQSAREEAEHGNRARDDILAVLSHELRTPLASILLQSQMLMQGQVPADKLEKTYAVIERGAKLQSQLIDDLLDASRIVSGRLKLEVQAFELCPVVQEAVASLQPAAATRGVTLEATVDESIGQVWSDPTRVRQVVIKLVANAIKFTPSGGRVSVELTLSDGAAALRVSDSGAGIGAEFLPHVFDRLTQQQSTITRRHGGLGLGLAIVHHVIESLGGRVTANSSGLGHGATFTATFPLTGFGRDDPALDRLDAAPTKALDRPGRTRNYGELHGLRVLVLDDDPGTLEAVTDVFRLSGSVVRSTASTAEALRVVEEFSPQVMVCDIAMPDSDGYAFIRQLRSRGPTRGGDTPALALTALSSADDRRRAFAAGYQRHMAKPVDIDLLRDNVVELLRTNRADPPS